MVANWNTVPNLPPNLTSLGNAFNEAFPRRDHSSDGAWGDAAHKLSPSGHKLDDTPGSLSETEDSDRIPELRAIDVDSDLNGGDDNMAKVIERIISSPDRNRLYYIIYNGRICGTWTGWEWVAYNGSNPHDKHAHFSGEPGSDSNGAPWKTITESGDDMDEAIRKYLKNGDWPYPNQARTRNQGVPTAFFEKQIYDLNQTIAELRKKISSLESTPVKTPTTDEIVENLLRRIPR